MSREIDVDGSMDTVFFMTLLRLWIAVFGILLLAILGLLSARREIALDLLIERAHAIGLAGFSVEVASIGIHRASLANLRFELGPGIPAVEAAVEAAKVGLHYSPRSLVENRLEGVHIEGLRLSATLHQGAFDLGSADLSAGTSGLERFAPFPIDSLQLEDARILLRSEDDEWRLASDVRSAIAQESAMNLEIALDLQVERLRFAARTELQGKWNLDGALRLAPVDCILIDLPSDGAAVPFHLASEEPLCLRGDPGLTIQMGNPPMPSGRLAIALSLDPIHLKGRVGAGAQAEAFEVEVPEVVVGYGVQGSAAKLQHWLSMAGGQLVLPAMALAVEELAVDLRFDTELDPWMPTGTIALGRIVDLEIPARFGPLSAHGQVVPEGHTLQFEIDVADLEGLLHLRIDGQHAFDTGSGSLKFALEPPVLESLANRLPELVPRLAGAFSDLSGDFDLTGSSRWQAGSTETELTLQARDLNLTASWGRLFGIDTTLRLQGPDPFYMAETQRVTLERFEFGVEFTECRVDFRLRRDGVVELPLLQWGIAGGTAQTSGLYDPRSEQHDFTIKLDGVDLAKLLRLLGVDGLTGEGMLAGVFPVQVDGDIIEVRNARLASTGQGGWLRYRPNAAALAASAQDDRLHQLTQLFDHFRFKTIAISLNGNVLGDVQTAIHLEGANPDFQQGLPVELNLNVESRLLDLIQEGSEAFRLAGQLADVLGNSSVRRNQQRPRVLDELEPDL